MISNAPLICRSRQRLMRLCSHWLIWPASSSIGNVPRPNASIIRPPVLTLALLTANSNAPYTKPQGNNPHNKPAPSARGIVLSGNMRCRIGASACHRRCPKISKRLSNGKPSIDKPSTIKTAASTPRGQKVSANGLKAVVPIQPANKPKPA